MLAIAKRTAVGAALLLIMPLAVWISGWQWQPGGGSLWLKMLFWVTETVTQPWRLVLVVSALPAAPGADAVRDSGYRHYGGAMV